MMLRNARKIKTAIHDFFSLSLESRARACMCGSSVHGSPLHSLLRTCGLEPLISRNIIAITRLNES